MRHGDVLTDSTNAGCSYTQFGIGSGSPQMHQSGPDGWQGSRLQRKGVCAILLWLLQQAVLLLLRHLCSPSHFAIGPAVHGTISKVSMTARSQRSTPSPGKHTEDLQDRRGLLQVSSILCSHLVYRQWAAMTATGRALLRQVARAACRPPLSRSRVAFIHQIAAYIQHASHTYSYACRCAVLRRRRPYGGCSSMVEPLDYARYWSPHRRGMWLVVVCKTPAQTQPNRRPRAPGTTTAMDCYCFRNEAGCTLSRSVQAELRAHWTTWPQRSLFK